MQTSEAAEKLDAGLLLLAFCAPWCTHCDVQRRAFERACEALKGAVRHRWVDIEREPAAVDRYAIEAIPMILVLRDGTECLRLVGIQTERMILDCVHALRIRPNAPRTSCGVSRGCSAADHRH